MAAPTIPVMPAGYGPTPADMNGWIQDPLTYLTSRPAFKVRQTASQNITNSTTTTIQFAVDEDPYFGWVTTGSAPNYRWVCPVAGWYQVTLTVWLGSAAGTQLLDAILNVNGTAFELSTPWLVTTDTAGGAGGGLLAYLAVGQYLQGQVFHTNAGTLATGATFGQQSYMAAHWVSS